MGKTYTFSAIIEAEGIGSAYVRIPFDVEKAFGRKRVPIQAKIEGQPYRGTLVRMGGPDHILIVLKAIRQKTGKDVGDTITVTLEEDLEQRKVDVPVDLAAALRADPEAQSAFEKLSYTHQREHVLAILEARKEETRRRVQKAVEMLKQGKRR